MCFFWGGNSKTGSYAVPDLGLAKPNILFFSLFFFSGLVGPIGVIFGPWALVFILYQCADFHNFLRYGSMGCHRLPLRKK